MRMTDGQGLRGLRKGLRHVGGGRMTLAPSACNSVFRSLRKRCMTATNPSLKPVWLLPPSVAMALTWAVPVAAYAITRLLDNSMRRPSAAAFVGHMLRLF